MEATPTTQAKKAQIRRFLTGFLGPAKGQSALKSYELYAFFMKHLDTPAAEVAARLNGFTEGNVLEIQRILKLQHGQSAAQRGGGPETAEEDKTQELYDKIFARMGSVFPPSWDRFFYYLFFLHAIENAKFIGPFATTFFDTISLSLPTIGEGVGTLLDKVSMVALSAVPGAAIAAPVIGYIPELLTGLVAINLDMSRKRFGQAFKKLLDLVPLLGETLSQAAVNFEVFLKNYEASRERLLKEAADLSPSAVESLACILPVVSKPAEGCPHPFDSEEIKAEMETRVFKEMPFLPAMGITRFEQLTPGGVLEALKSKVRGALPQTPTLPTPASAATGLVRGVGSRALIPTPSAATAATGLVRGVGSRALVPTPSAATAATGLVRGVGSRATRKTAAARRSRRQTRRH